MPYEFKFPDVGEGIHEGTLVKWLVKEGQEVTTDTVIGEVGSTGRSTGPHLHLEIRENGRTVNPKTLLEIK